jgi:thioredoxin reductase
MAACPVGAITLVFGSETRGIDIPNLSPEFETNVRGLYIAGELGGMGLVRNAAEQGKQAIAALKKTLMAKSQADYDVIIVGAGPAGIAAALTAQAEKLKYLVLEQDSLGGTVSHFPRRKIVMTSPVKLPLVGKMQFREARKEALLEYWEKVVNDHNLKINFQVRLEDITANSGYFDVASDDGHFTAQRVLLCLGRRGTPRKLGVPGEEQGKVIYRLVDPEQFKSQCVLVVGGGDSALEAALSLTLVEGTSVSLAYRGSAFSRAKEKNRLQIESAAESQKINLLLESQVTEIFEREVTLESNGACIKLQNDSLIVCAGGVLPTPFLEKLGIEINTKYGTV